MTHPTRAFSGSIINRFTGSKILARVGQISVAFPKDGKPIDDSQYYRHGDSHFWHSHRLVQCSRRTFSAHSYS